MHPDNIAVIVLAAGLSTRFGKQKMSHHLDDGKTIFETCIERYQKVFKKNVTVVISDDYNLRQRGIKSGINVVEVDNPAKGMSHSIIMGIQSQPNASAWLIALGDMPYVKTDTLIQLAAKATENNIAVPVYDSRRGNPAILGCAFKEGLLSLQGDVGAKELINNSESRVCKVYVDDMGVLHDIDRPGDVL